MADRANQNRAPEIHLRIRPRWSKNGGKLSEPAVGEGRSRERRQETAAPLASEAEVLLLQKTESPQFFPSQAAVIALIETLIALIVAHGDDKIVEWMDDLERVRAEEGLILKRGEG